MLKKRHVDVQSRLKRIEKIKNFRKRLVRLVKLRRLRLILKTRRVILGLNPDAVIAFEAGSGSVVTASLIHTEIPIVLSERNNPNPRVRKPRSFLSRRRLAFYRRGVECSVQTPGYAEWCKENWNIEATITPNHLMPEELVDPEIAAARRPNNRFVALGRYVPQKGFQDLLQAWKLVEKEDGDVELSLYGFEDSEHLKKLSRELGLRRVEINGPTAETTKVLDESRCLISPSYYEGFPNVVLEALGRAIPVIATPSSDVIEVMAKGGAVRMVPIGDPESLARAILAEKDADFAASSRMAFATALEFSWANVGPSWESAIDKARAKGGFQLTRSR